MGKTYKPVIKPGTHLASSKDTKGAMRGTLLDNKTNKIVGQAEWKEVSDSSSLLGKIVVAGTIAAGSAITKKAIENHMAASLEKEEAARQQLKQTRAPSAKARIKQEIKMEEYRQKELRKSEKRIARQQAREEKWDQRKESMKAAAASGGIHLLKGLGFLIKHLFLALFWCLKQLCLGLYKLAKWGFQNASTALKQRAEEKQMSGSVTEVQAEPADALVMTPEHYSDLVEEAVENFQNNMSSEEAQMHLLKILALSLELAQEIREFVSKGTEHADMLDAEKLQWQQALGKMATEKAVTYINSALSDQHLQLESDTLDVIAVNLYDGDKERLGAEPLCLEQIQEALHLE